MDVIKVRDKPDRTLDSNSLCWRSFFRYSATALRRLTASSASAIFEIGRRKENVTQTLKPKQNGAAGAL